MNISNYELAEDKKDGTWFRFDGAEFLIAYAHRPAFYRAHDRMSRKYPEHKLKADPALRLRSGAELLAECILLDWRGVNENGKPIPYSKETAVKLLMKIEPLREWVAVTSRELTEFQQEAIAEDAAALKSGDGVATPVGEG